MLDDDEDDEMLPKSKLSRFNDVSVLLSVITSGCFIIGMRAYCTIS